MKKSNDACAQKILSLLESVFGSKSVKRESSPLQLSIVFSTKNFVYWMMRKQSISDCVIMTILIVKLLSWLIIC